MSYLLFGEVVYLDLATGATEKVFLVRLQGLHPLGCHLGQSDALSQLPGVTEVVHGYEVLAAYEQHRVASRNRTNPTVRHTQDLARKNSFFLIFIRNLQICDNQSTVESA